MKKALIILGSIFALFGAAVVLVLVIALSGGENESPKKVETSTSTNDKVIKADQQGDEYFKVGDTIEIDGLNITITKAYFTNANQYVPPEKGKVLALDIVVENVSDKSNVVDNTSFDLYDLDGNALEQYYALDQTISGEVHPGKKRTGVVYFDVPESQQFELIYTPFMSWSNDTATFIIDVQ